MRQVPLERDINIVVNGPFLVRNLHQERLFMAMFISRGTCLIGSARSDSEPLPTMTTPRPRRCLSSISSHTGSEAAPSIPTMAAKVWRGGAALLAWALIQQRPLHAHCGLQPRPQTNPWLFLSHYPSRCVSGFERIATAQAAVPNYALGPKIILVPGDAIKRDPERENYAVLTIAAQTANSIHIRVTFNAVTRYVVVRMSELHLMTSLFTENQAIL